MEWRDFLTADNYVEFLKGKNEQEVKIEMGNFFIEKMDIPADGFLADDIREFFEEANIEDYFEDYAKVKAEYYTLRDDADFVEWCKESAAFQVEREKERR